MLSGLVVFFMATLHNVDWLDNDTHCRHGIYSPAGYNEPQQELYQGSLLEPLGELTRVGFLGRLCPFALARAKGCLPFAPFHSLPFSLFLSLVLRCGRPRTGGRKVLRPRLRPQGCWWPGLP